MAASSKSSELAATAETGEALLSGPALAVGGLLSGPALARGRLLSGPALVVGELLSGPELAEEGGLDSVSSTTLSAPGTCVDIIICKYYRKYLIRNSYKKRNVRRRQTIPFSSTEISLHDRNK